jgi:hypothetical protein
MEKKQLTIDQLMEKLEKKFPKAWFKEGGLFNSAHAGTIWTGEGSYNNKGEELFKYHEFVGKYDMGIHKDLREFLDKNGAYAEAYDSGTYFISFV